MTTIRAILCSSPLTLVINHSNRVASECQCSEYDGATRLKFGAFHPQISPMKSDCWKVIGQMAGGDLATSSRWTHSGRVAYLVLGEIVCEVISKPTPFGTAGSKRSGH